MPAQTVIQLRRDTAANWASGDPLLAAGEIGLETNTGKFKIGDGTLHWLDLDYATDWANVTSKPTSFTPSTHASTHADGGTDEITIAASQITASTTSGQVLSSDGTTTVWSTPSSGLPTQGSGTTGEMLVSNGTDAEWTNTVTANSTSTPALIVKALLNQTGTLQRWVNSNNDTLISFSGTNTAGMEVGRTDGTASTPFIDFHSGATATDHDSRIIASGGNGTNAGGSLEFQAASVTVSGTLTANPAAPANANTAKAVGYIGMPQTALASGGLTLSATHAGDHIYVTGTGQTITIPANSSVPFEIGTTIVIINAASVTTSIAITSDTLLLAGAGTTGTRTLAAHGMATLVKITATSWIISGNGLS